MEDIDLKVDDWNEKNKETNYKIIKQTSYLFWKIMTFMFFMLFLTTFIFIVYIWYINDFKGIVQTNINNTINVKSPDVPVTNNYDFTPDTDNYYEHEINTYNYPNITVINKIYLNSS